MIKICQNVLCGKEFEPLPQLEKRQKYCHACSQLPVKARRRTELIQDRVCVRAECRKTFTPRWNMLHRQKYCNAYCQQQDRMEKSRKHGARNLRKTPTVQAICPKCERKHKIHMEWNKTYPPRIFCTPCEIYRTSSTFSGLMTDIVFMSGF